MGGNALSLLVLPKPQKKTLKRKPGDYPSDETYTQLLQMLPKWKNGIEYVFLARLQAELGLRVSEALSLNKDVLDIVELEGAKHTITFKRKGGEIDSLPISQKHYEELRKWKGFTVTRQGFDDVLKLTKLLTKAGKRLHSHALRKYFGHKMIEKKGVSTAILICQAVYNHKNIQMTIHYLDVHKFEPLRQFAEMLN